MLEAQLGCLLARELEHRLGEVAPDHLALRPDALAELDRQVAGPGRDVERARARRQRRHVGRALAPAMVQPCGHDRVHQVVDAGDAVEHRLDLRLGERARRGHRPRYFSDPR